MNCPNCGKKVKDKAKKCPHCKELIANIKTNKETFFDNKWEVVDLIGEGSFGKVYKTKKEEFGLITFSAIKTINIPQNRSEIQELKNEGMNNEEICEYYQTFVKKWLDEIKLMQNLKSSLNVVNVEDYEVIEDVKKNIWKINIRMELLEGIESFYEGKTITNKDILKMGIDIAKALEHCKKYNIIHRDIKPDNIFISELGDFKLGDFGIARNLEKTTSGLSKKGTYTYMAPEVYKGLEYNSTIDIYSLGLVLYKYFNVGRLPFLPEYPKKITFEDKENSVIRRMNGEEVPKPLNATDEEAKIILKMIAFDSKDRYKTASTLISDLEKVYKEAEVKAIIEEKTENKNDGNTGKKIDKTVSVFDESLKSDKTVSILDEKKVDKTVSILDEKKIDKTISILDEKKIDKTVSILDSNKTVAINDNFDKINKENDRKNKKKKLNKKIKVLIGSISILVVIVLMIGLYLVMNYRQVPNVVGLSSENAIQKLKDSDFKEEIVKKEIEDDRIGTIIEQESEGKYLKKKSIIKLTLGVSSEQVEMRNVVGLTVDEARNTLKEIDIDINVSENYDDTIPAGVVISQVTQAGEKLPRGSIVDILVSKGKQEVNDKEPTKQTTKKTTKKEESDWSSWSTSLPKKVSDKNYNIQTKTQYRSRKKEYTTDTASSKSGWTKYDQSVSYSNWSSNKTSTSKVSASDVLEIVKTESKVTSVTWYHYDNFYDGRWNVDSIAWGSGSSYHEVKAPIDANFGIYYDSDKGGRQMYSNGAYFCPGGWQVWFRGPEHKTTTYTYRTRTKTTTYYFYRFGDWSSWSDTKIDGNNDLEVDTQKLYRYRKK